MVCLWDVDTGCCTTAWEAATELQRARAAEYATNVLWALTGRQFGTCPMTVRPCAGYDGEQTWQWYGVMADAGTGGSYVPYLWDGLWRNCGTCGGACGCGPANQIWLPGPVAAISEVRIDNAVVPTSSYRVDDGQWLVRDDGDSWPLTQDLNVPGDSTAGTFVVTYLRGVRVPLSGQMAAGTLACEYLKACMNLPCRLPSTIQSLTRQGVSMSRATGQTVAEGYTGLPDVDSWVFTVNPKRLVDAPRVWSLDLPAPRVTTWGAP